MFEGVGHQEIPLRSLDMGLLHSSAHLIAGLQLCQDVQLRDFSFDTGDVPVSSLPEIGILKDRCPQVSVLVTCSACEFLPVIQALHKLLAELRIQGIFSRAPNELSSCSALCTKLQSLKLSV